MQYEYLDLYTKNHVAHMFLTSSCKTQAEFEQFDYTDFFLQEVTADPDKFAFAFGLVNRNRSKGGIDIPDNVPLDLCIIIGWIMNSGSTAVKSVDFGLDAVEAALQAVESVKNNQKAIDNS